MEFVFVFGWSMSEPMPLFFVGVFTESGSSLYQSSAAFGREGSRLNQVHRSWNVQIQFCMLLGACLVGFARLDLQRSPSYVIGFVGLWLYSEALGFLRCGCLHLFDRDTCSGASSFKFRSCSLLRLRTRVVNLHLHLCAVVVFCHDMLFLKMSNTILA